MGLLDSLLGNAGEMDMGALEAEVANLLAEGETVHKGFKLMRDFFIFTNKRMLMVDKQGISGKKVCYHSIPYKSVTQFSLETGGTFDMDAELKIWVSGAQMPIEQKIAKGCDILGLQRELSNHVLN